MTVLADYYEAIEKELKKESTNSNRLLASHHKSYQYDRSTGQFLRNDNPGYLSGPRKVLQNGWK